MRKTLCRTLLLTVCLLMAGSLAYGLGGYKDLLWIDARGYIIHVTADGSTTLTSFLRYREVRYEKNTRKPGHFVCVQDGIEKQIPVRDIRCIKLALDMEDLEESPYADRLQRIILTMKNGESFHARVASTIGRALSNDEYLMLKYWDPVTQQFTFGGFNGNTIREIRFE